MIRKRSVSILALASLMFIPAAALAQSGIAGVVKDATGAVLPGVTVEAASPALIEKVRTVVTDGQGLYKIVDLRPGVYAVTFTLVGFSPVKREGIELTTNFTAAVNAELRVGAIAETVTVSGRSPVVDVQNVVQQRVVTADVIEALPTGRQYQNLAALIPGIVLAAGRRPATQDVGGSAGTSFQTIAIHGGRASDMIELVDGMPQSALNGAQYGGIMADAGAMQEFTWAVGALSAESPTGGVQFNQIPKEGSNLFEGSFFAGFTNQSLQSDNFTDQLRARGLSAVNRLDKIWDLNPSFGGPIKRAKLWFYLSARYWGYNEWVAGRYWAKDPLAFVYSPDLSRQALDDAWYNSASLRLTWQATQKNKVNAYVVNQARCVCHSTDQNFATPEASYRNVTPVDYAMMVTWSAPVSNRLLLDAGVVRVGYNQPRLPQPFVTPDTLSVTELSTGLIYRAAPSFSRTINYVWNSRASLSYVTGSHAFKVGFTLREGVRHNSSDINGALNLQLLNGVPRSVTVNTTPWVLNENLNAVLGLFAQDQWTIKRLTLNGGVRFDHHNSSVGEQHLPAVRFLGPRDFAAVPDVPNWNDLSPRLGASYALFGTGKTALKVTLSRYVASETLAFTNANNPVVTSVNSATRTWNDLNGNFNPDCDFLNPAANAECGALSDANFGKVRVTTHYDDAVRQGFGSRGYNWETSAGVQHEFMPRVSVNATYFRRWYGNFTVTDNLAVTPADYDPYCITAPVDARLPGGGGNQVCGLYDINPAKFGQVNNLVTFAKNYGTQTEVHNGVDLTMNARLPHGALVSGGLNVGRSETNNCFVIDSPQPLQFCDVKPPFQSQVKFLSTYPLPWNLQASGTFQSLPGPEVRASYLATSAEIRPSLGRNLASGANGTATIDLIRPGTRYEERLYQVDVRLSNIFKVGRVRIQGNFDLYNALNANTILLENARYGPAWLSPTYILPGRMFKFGAQVNF